MKRSRSALIEAAELHPLSFWQRLARLQFRTHRPIAESPVAQTAGEGGDPARRFRPTEEGSGIFGRWTVDEAGLPAYEYTFDQYQDARASYPNSEGRDRRDHWHQVGNQRVTALASNDGVVQVYLADRGGVILNKFEAHDSTNTSGSLLALLSRLALAIIRFVAGLWTRRDQTVKPFAAEDAIGLRAADQPRGSLSADDMAKRREELSDSLLESYDLLSEQDEPLASSAPPPRPLLPRDQVATQYAFAGGYGYLDDGAQVWSTAYRYRPQGAKTRRIFGMGYFETETTHRYVRVQRQVYAPDGDVPFVMADVWIQNFSDAPVTLRYYEYWDVNVQQLRIEWLRSAAFGSASDEERRALNRQFTQSIAYLNEEHTLEFRQEPPPDAPPPDEPSAVNWYPAPVFLADLTGDAPDAHYFNKASFFGMGGAREPDLIKLRGEDAPFNPRSPLEPMPYCMVLRKDFTLKPGEGKTLRFAYGAALPEERRKAISQLIDEPALALTQSAWQERLVYADTGEDPVVQREMAWHSYNLQSAVTRNQYHGVHLVPQGSAYLYLHGADGAPRDQALFALPMTYLNPELAKDLLRLVMRLTDGQTGQIPYSFTGHGYLSNGLNIHTTPSDLDLFFLLALTEYLAATNDLNFLKEAVPFYPPDRAPSAPGITVLDHVRVALTHLFEKIGLGENGLLRVRSGDWSDSIVLETAIRDGLLGTSYQNSKAHGESIPNSQMALYVLPLLATQLQQVAPDVTRLLRDGRVERLRIAVNAQWTEQGWYRRAVLRGSNNEPMPVEHLSLEAQVWGLISGAAKLAGREAALIERVEASLDRPSPIGAGLTPGGAVWPAVSQLLTWAYARAGREELAWRSLNRHLFAIHAQQYPAIWFGIWSGPDGLNGVGDGNPGGTWQSPLTPMTDFPVMNANPDAMALLGWLRVCGVEPAPEGDGLVIRPRLPRRQFVVDTPLLRVELRDGKISGEYRAWNAGFMNLYLYPPGSELPIVKPLSFYAGQRVPFSM